MSARTIKNPTTISGQGILSSQSVRLTNGVNYCALNSNSSGELLINGQPISGGGAIDAVLAGDGISVSGTTDVTVSNTGVLSIVAGDGVSVSTVGGDSTVSNTGVLSIVAGDNITTSEAAGVVTINGAAGGGIVDSLIAGDGISVSGTTDVTVSNTGVLSIVAGSNITTSEAAGVVTINATVNNNIGGIRGTFTINDGIASGTELNTQVTILNFVGSETTAYVSSVNYLNGFDCTPFTIISEFFSTDNTNTVITVNLQYIEPSTYSGTTFELPFSVIALNI
jgi:hypothetical protein